MNHARLLFVLLTSLAGSALHGQSMYTVAGGSVGDGGPAKLARVSRPSRSRVDAAGNIYIADLFNNRVRRVDATTQIITTVAGSGIAGFSGDGGPATAAALLYPWDVAIDTSGNLFIVDMGNQRIRRVDAATDIITTVAGGGSTFDDGVHAIASALEFPRGVKTDSAGNLYIADAFRGRIRKVDAATQIITTVAGRGSGYGGDGGPATSALFNLPQDVAFDAAGNLYIVDTNNHRIRRVDAATQIITTVAGGGRGFTGDGGPATAAALNSPNGIAFDASGNLYIADSLNYRIRKVDATTGIITTFAGNGELTLSSDGQLATEGGIGRATGIAIDAFDNVYITDDINGRIRRVNGATKIITTVAGETESIAGDGGLAVAALLLFPEDVDVDSSRNLYIADTSNQRIRRVDAATGIITTIAGNGRPGFSGDGGPATAAALQFPGGVAIDEGGNVYIADSRNHRIRRVDWATKIITTVAGNGTEGSSGDGGPAEMASLSRPVRVMVDISGNLYIADSSNHRVRMVDAATKIITTVAGNGTRGFSGDGGAATAAMLNFPDSVARDAAGNLYIADLGNDRIRKVDATTKIITTFVARNQGATPSDLAIDVVGNLYFVDHQGGFVKKREFATGTITIVAGNGLGGFSGDGLAATASSLGSPLGVAVDAFGTVYIADTNNQRIRAVMPVGSRRRGVRR